MTPEEAIKILDNIAAQAQLSRRDHEIVVQAIQIINDLIKKTKNDNKSE